MESGSAVFALFFRTASLGVEMVVTRRSGDNLAFLRYPKSFSERFIRFHSLVYPPR